VNAVICSRVSELQETLSAGTIALEISSRNARVQAMQDRWSMLRAGIAQLMIERAADMAEAPGGGTGLPVRHYQGGALAKPVYKVDTGLVSLIAQLLAHEKQGRRARPVDREAGVLQPRGNRRRESGTAGHSAPNGRRETGGTG